MSARTERLLSLPGLFLLAYVLLSVFLGPQVR